MSMNRRDVLASLALLPLFGLRGRKVEVKKEKEVKVPKRLRKVKKVEVKSERNLFGKKVEVKKSTTTKKEVKK